MSQKAKRNPELRKQTVENKFYHQIQQQERNEHERFSKRVSK